VTPAAAAGTPAIGTPAFTSAVRPILVARCAPCHEAGGKMYERLPFDRAAVERWLDAQEREAGAGTR